MKKSILKIMLISLFFSCNSDTNKSEKTIKNYLFTHLHDFDSYQSVEFGTIDSVYSTPESIPHFSDKKAVLDSAIARYITYGNEFKEQNEKGLLDRGKQRMYLTLLRNNRKTIESLKPYVDSVSKSFKKDFIGYKRNHTFRSKTLDGNFKLATNIYFFNKKLDSITNVIEN